MGYTPVINSAASLTIWLGVVNTSASVSLSGNVITIDPSEGFEFSSADVNGIIQVLGAGAAGAPLWTTISSYTNPTTATLTAASTAVSGAQAVLYRPFTTAQQGNVNWILQGSIAFQTSLTTDPTLDFDIFSSNGSFVPAVGQPVLMTDSDGTVGTAYGSAAGDIFGGSIEQVKTTNYPGNPGDAIKAACECVSWNAIFRRRVLGLAGAFPITQSTIDFNGGEEWAGIYNGFYHHYQKGFTMPSPPPLSITDSLGSIPGYVYVNGVAQSLGPFAAIPGYPPFGPVQPGDGVGGYDWYWSFPYNMIYQDAGQTTLTDADAVVLYVTEI